MTTTLELPTTKAGRRGRLRRRFTVVSAALLSTLMAILGVSFANDAGTTSVTVSGATSAIAVYPVTGAAPMAAVTLPTGSTKTATTPEGSPSWATAVSPAWSVAAGSAGSVPADGDGDLAYLDATGSTADSMMVSLFVTNLDVLAANYSSYNFKVTLWKDADTPNSTAPTAVTGWDSVETQVLTSDSGTLNWVVDIEADAYYAITLDEGGSFYTVTVPDDSNPADVAAKLSPAFFIRATQL